MGNSPFMGAGIFFKNTDNPWKVKYQAAHYEIAASAKAVMLAHELMSDAQAGCRTILSLYLQPRGHIHRNGVRSG